MSTMKRTERLTGQADFATLGQTGGERQRLPNVRLFKIGKIGQELRKRAPGGHGLDNHADRHPHPPDARLAPHLIGMDRDPLEVLHTRILPQSEFRGASGTAGLLNLSGQIPGFAVALYPQRTRDHQRIRGRGLFQRALIPQGPDSVLFEGAPVKTVAWSLSTIMEHPLRWLAAQH